MKWMEFVKPDIRVLIIFLVLLAISYYNRTTYPGMATEKLKPTLTCPLVACNQRDMPNTCDYNHYSYNYYGEGWPFMCFNVGLDESCCNDNGVCVSISTLNSKELTNPAPYGSVFVPENFILDVIILYIIALLAVRIYDGYFSKKKK